MHNLTVLYVEDNKDTREMTSILLENLCSKLYVATNGQEGLELFKQHHIDVVLTDITMPTMDGLEMTQAIKNLYTQVPIIIFSAYSDSKYLFKAIDMGVSNYLVKPVQTAKLEKLLDEIEKQKDEKEQLQYYKQELEKINKDLEKRVKQELKKNKLQDTIMFSQSKTAQMGEMLSMIAHQWRQPLNVIAAAAIRLELQANVDQLDSDSVVKTTKFIQEHTQKLSKTIDDFMNFFKPEKEKEHFTIINLFQEIQSLVEAQIESQNISLEFSGENIEIYTYEKELSHILLNLLSNAKDAFSNTQENKKIQLSVVENKENITIYFQDNAGGIEEDKIDRIFDAYFTTKEQGKGTGIGLYMSKRIVNEVLQGEIYAYNKNGGAVFEIKLKKEKN